CMSRRKCWRKTKATSEKSYTNSSPVIRLTRRCFRTEPPPSPSPHPQRYLPMTDQDQKQLGKTLCNIADQLRGAMNADDFRDYMLAFLFLRYLSDNYETAAKKELGVDYPKPGNGDGTTPLEMWYGENPGDVAEFEKQ